ncbi:T9SS type A sorting domain-containing protein [Parabacteroides sp. PF5-6]|uniref:T9SS type A sorting domain-containing protein n=1 Tax=Parabacteroides sp. PF5-6 TaxID=1742403 RepID=UPI0024056DFA|nr:T9SS type A sorting domain-containing protein [Parabacteroides sp. PF5-6]MDF9830843.1 hypothetical protein [Parabacteroides sp. PF5-6]
MRRELHLALTLLFTLTALAATTLPAKGQTRIYVKQEVATPGNGSSWDNAYKELREALVSDAARSATAANPVEIWVAQGEYTPTDGTDRNAKFTILANVSVYGGFAGTETSLSARDWVKNQTTLSGDISPGNNDDCYSVVYLSSGTLDGFHITGANSEDDGIDGGGVCANGGTLRNNTIYGNTATNGGGVYAYGGATLTGNTIYGNKATYGGGGVVADGATLTNNTIYGNTATSGGGVVAEGATLTGNTIYGNTAAYSGGGVHAFATTLTNNILWGNNITAGGIQDLYVDTPASGSHNLVGGVIGGDGFDGVSINTNPRFVDPTNGDLRLLPSSPAIGTGKPLADGTPTDMGAFPYPVKADKNGIVYVNASVTGGNGDGSSWINALTDLSDALVTNAAQKGIREIWVAKGKYMPKYDRYGYIPGDYREATFVIPTGIALYGGFAGGETSLSARDWITNQTILSGDIDPHGDNDCYNVVYLTGGTLDAFHITGAKDSEGSAIQGGGVYAFGGATLTNNTIYGNTANHGGGVYATGGAILTGNTIYGNTATTGGGVYGAEGATLTHNTIYANTARNGGGVFIYDGTVTLTNNILWANTAGKDNEGDNLHILNGTPSITYNLIGDESIQDGHEGVGERIGNLIGADNDPLFVKIDTESNPKVYDFHLQAGSPAIGTGLDGADMGAYPYIPADPATYHPLTLEVAPGILLYGISAGEHLVSDHLFLQFLPEDPTLGPEDLMLVIDGVDTPFTVPAGGAYYGYILPITAEHTILIAQRRYNVILTPTEGVTYTPGAGTHPVDYGNPFSFTVTGAFDPAQLQVFANGQEILPDGLRSTTLSYTIDAVTGPITVTLEGTGGTTGNIDLATAPIRVIVESGKLKVENEMSTAIDVAIYSVTGQNVVQLRGLRGSKTIALAAGVYFVRAGQQTWKVIVND